MIWLVNWKSSDCVCWLIYKNLKCIVVGMTWFPLGVVAKITFPPIIWAESSGTLDFHKLLSNFILTYYSPARFFINYALLILSRSQNRKAKDVSMRWHIYVPKMISQTNTCGSPWELRFVIFVCKKSLLSVVCTNLAIIAWITQFGCIGKIKPVCRQILAVDFLFEDICHLDGISETMSN